MSKWVIYEPTKDSDGVDCYIKRGEIVHCRECKYWKSTVQMPNGTEVKCLYGRKDDDFCSYGDKRDD